MSKPTFSLTVDSDYLGIDILGTFSTAGYLTVTRITNLKRETVRCLDATHVTTATYGVVDVEMPIDVEVWYEMTWTSDTASGDNTSVVSPPASGAGFVVSDTTGQSFIVRDLFKQTASFATDWTLGPLNDEEVNVRGGVFNVIGREDPVVVVDVRESIRGTMRLITTTRTASEQMREIVTSGSPLLLQIPDEYMVGDNGVLFFQPTKTSVKRPLSDGVLPQRIFDIDYVQISRPPAAVTFPVPGTTYDTVNSTYASYAALLGTAPHYNTYFYIAYGVTFGF